jgi:hypothetical protein
VRGGVIAAPPTNSERSRPSIGNVTSDWILCIRPLPPPRESKQPGTTSTMSGRRIRVRVEIMGSQTCRIVGKSQPVLIMINPMISTRTRTRGVGGRRAGGTHSTGVGEGEGLFMPPSQRRIFPRGFPSKRPPGQLLQHY